MSDHGVDLVTLKIVCNQLKSVAEGVEQVFITSSYSPNVEKRRDCPTALFDADDHLVAQAERIPVHLGAISEVVDTALDYGLEPGDMLVLSGLFKGGTHLPDMTTVSPLSVDGEVFGYAVSRTHHADVGRMTPGSIPIDVCEIYQEGLRLPLVRLVADGETNDDMLLFPLANVHNPGERRADIRAQLAASEHTEERLADLIGEHGQSRVLAAFGAVMDYSRNRVTVELRGLPDGGYRARDVLKGNDVTDDGTPVEVITAVGGNIVALDFDSTANQAAGNVNAPLMIAKNAVYFVVRYVTDPRIPLNQGCHDPISVEVPNDLLFNPDTPAAVVDGNVEASQCVTNVVFTALADAAPERVPAQGQGAMSNLAIGSRVGGSDGFTYYETIGDGFGGRTGGDGMGGVQIGMANALNTLVETLEAEYPLFTEAYDLREGSGGHGEFRGGLGIVQSVTAEVDTIVSFLTERRRVAPRGIVSGKDGATGRNLVDGEAVPSKTTRDMSAGTTVTIWTPGDGGYGDPDDRDADVRRRDREDGKAE